MASSPTIRVVCHALRSPDLFSGHLQAATGAGTAERTLQLTRQLIHTHGFTSLYRGLTPAVLGAGPAHALYYAVYEQTKQALGARQPGRRPLTVAAAGLPSGLWI